MERSTCRVSPHCASLDWKKRLEAIGFAELTDSLIIVWVAALLYAIFIGVVARYRGPPSRRPIFGVLLQSLSFGGMLTIFGIAKRANDLGLISSRLYLFMVFATAVAVGCGGWAALLQSRPEAMQPDRLP
jgi:hypothetical protein